VTVHYTQKGLGVKYFYIKKKMMAGIASGEIGMAVVVEDWGNIVPGMHRHSEQQRS